VRGITDHGLIKISDLYQTPAFVVQEITVDAVSFMSTGKKLQGIVEGESNPDVFIPRLIALHRAGLFPFDRLIKFYPFAEINQAISDSESGVTIKPVIRF
jgi:aryl-alcohol dehydrogenase